MDPEIASSFAPAPASPPLPVEPGSRTRAGVGLVSAAVGTAVGYWLGGPIGAGAGLLLTGAARNTLRATRYWADPDPAARLDAGTSAGLALLGAAVGAALAYHAYRIERE